MALRRTVWDDLDGLEPRCAWLARDARDLFWRWVEHLSNSDVVEIVMDSIMQDASANLNYRRRRTPIVRDRT